MPGFEICAFIQARMSSQRFPGKVLAPFRGRPLIDSVVTAACAGVATDVPVVVLTSDHPTDDPLAAYLRHSSRHVFRGPLDDVFSRFVLALAEWPCEWMLRVNADSPMLSPEIVRQVVGARDVALDLVTTVFPRTWPKGQNVELINRRTFAGLDPSQLDEEDREHVTRFFYRHPDRFRIGNVASNDDGLAALDFAVDTVDDLARLERMPLDRLTARLHVAGSC